MAQVENMEGVSKQKIAKAIQKEFPQSKVKSVYQFKRGYNNKTFRIILKNPNKKIVFRLFSHEQWKADKEQYVYDLIRKKTNVPVPKVHSVNNSKKIFSHPYLIQDHIEGVDLRKTFSQQYNSNLARKAGEYLAALHSIPFKNYGWIIGNTIQPQFKKWTGFIHYDLKTKISALRKIPKSSLIFLANLE